MRRGIPPARHVGLSDSEASKEVEEGVEVCRADSCQLHVGSNGNCHHTCTTCTTCSVTKRHYNPPRGRGVVEEQVAQHCRIGE